MPQTGALAPYHRYRIVGLWLFALAAMVFVMVVIGGLTRLTSSGLSMVEWRPVTGWLPPLSDAAWEATFRAYQATPEYRHINAGMSLGAFKGIFWLEYVHRLWGRMIGIVFFVPFPSFSSAAGSIAGLRRALPCSSYLAACRALSAGSWSQAASSIVLTSASIGWSHTLPPR